jgi:tetratricopeptide (TPR) repeat protein
VADRLRALWDFDDLDSTERRFRDLLERETDSGERAQIVTQLARIHGLRGDFESGERQIEEARGLAGESGAALARIDLERGRLRRSSDNKEVALPLFESAFAKARDADEPFLAADAAHMAALAAPDRRGFVAWTERGIELGESDESARYWLGPLLNNLGWEHFDAGEHEAALAAFERALRERERDPGNRQATEIARYAVAKALRMLGRPEEAVAQLEPAVAWAEDEASPDGWFHEELAESYAVLGRSREAAEQARKALVLLPDADPSFEDESQRATRLRQLAEQSEDPSR